MARKIECDRCGKQWVPEPYDEYDAEPTELSTCSFNIPWARDISIPKGWEQRPGIVKVMELCQSCARAVYAIATTNPETDSPASAD